MKNFISISILALFSAFLLTACGSTNVYITPTNTGTEQASTQNTQENIVTSTNQEKAPQYTEVKISSAKDLYQNIKPYTKLILTEEYYNISNIDVANFQSENITLDNCYDGYEFIIHDVSHFEICAADNVLPEIVTEGAHVNVISLSNCQDVKIDSLVLGHEVEKGTCFGGVIQLKDCSNITINGCHLYGCGTYGIIASNCNNISVNCTDIYECSYGILDLNTSNHFAFNNCIFRNNEKYTMFALPECNDIKFNDCTIVYNSSDYASSLVSASDSKDITFTRCLLENNEYSYLCSTEDDVKFVGCTIKDENFENKYYIDYEE